LRLPLDYPLLFCVIIVPSPTFVLNRNRSTVSNSGSYFIYFFEAARHDAWVGLTVLVMPHDMLHDQLAVYPIVQVCHTGGGITGNATWYASRPTGSVPHCRGLAEGLLVMPRVMLHDQLAECPIVQVGRTGGGIGMGEEGGGRACGCPAGGPGTDAHNCA
jgi:hypothetical protein